MIAPATTAEFFAAYAAVVGPICLSAITEGQARVPTRTFTDARAAAKWIAARNGDANCYFIPNKVARPLGKKASRSDIGEIVAAFADLDPVKAHDLAAERTRIKAAIDALAPPPSMVIDSGGGFQIFWFFDTPLPPARHDEAEALNRAIAATLGGDRAATPISNLMRVPFTTNFPNAAKRKVGRVERRAELVAMDVGRRYTFDALQARWPGEVKAKGNGADDAPPPEFLRGHAASGRGLSGDPHDNPEPATREKIERAMAVVPNADLDWYDWTRVGLALFASLGDDGFAVFQAFSKKSEKYVEADTAARWREIKNSPPDHIGAGTIFFLADAADPSWRDEPKASAPPEQSKLDALLSSAADLQHMTFDPLRWIVPEYLPEGLTVLAGKPKIGKSWLALDAAIAVASGGQCLGKQCEPGDVLALLLEDNKRRLQRRMTMMIGANKERWPARLRYATEWPRGDDGLTLMREWVAVVEKPRLIIVDVLQRIRAPANNRSRETQYSVEYEAMAALQKITAEVTGLAILVVHHQRKLAADDPLDTLSGTLGLTGAMDSGVILGTDDDGKFLYGRGRDLDEYNINVRQGADCRWQAGGPRGEPQPSTERRGSSGR